MISISCHYYYFRYWITNGAVHAKHVVVMAQLLVNGKNEVTNWNTESSHVTTILTSDWLITGHPRGAGQDEGR